MATLKNVLIVEDDADMRRLVDLCLRADGHQTSFAVDGASAIGVARSANPDLIVLDIGLPAGDGFTVMDRLNKMPMLSHVPVIVLSGRDAAGDESQALAAGARAFVAKPFIREEFVAVVREVLGGPAAENVEPSSEHVEPSSEHVEPTSENGVAADPDAPDSIREFLHDLRTPVAVVEGFASRLIEGEDVTPESIAESAEVIHRNAKKLGQLIESFSDSYHSGLKPADLRGTVARGTPTPEP